MTKDNLKHRVFLCGSDIIEFGGQHAQWKSRISQSSDQQFLLWPGSTPAEHKLVPHHRPPLSFPSRPGPLWAGPSLLDTEALAVFARFPANLLSLKGHTMIRDDPASIVPIRLRPSLAWPQFPLPRAGSINYYSNCFSQPADLKLTACSSVLLHGGQRERERESGIKRKETPESRENFQKKAKFLGILV